MESDSKTELLTCTRAVVFHNGAIGDFLMLVYLAELLRMSGYVDHVIIVAPRNLSFLQGLIGAYPYISTVEASRRGGMRQLLKMVGRHVKFLIIQPTVGKIPIRIKLVGWCISRFYGSQFVGFQDQGPLCRTVYTKVLNYNTNQLYSESIQDMVRAIGAPVLVQTPALKIVSDFKLVQGYGLSRKPYVVFHPGASAPRRSFSIQSTREIIKYVLQRNRDFYVVLSGSGAEAKWIEEIRNGIKEKERVVPATDCSAQELAAFIQSARVFVGTDSGITHLACFLRAPVVVAAHCGTANWLPFYCPTATILYRLEEEEEVHNSREYLDMRRRGRLKPFGVVPVGAICAAIDRFVSHSPGQEIAAQEIVL